MDERVWAGDVQSLEARDGLEGFCEEGGGLSVMKVEVALRDDVVEFCEGILLVSGGYEVHNFVVPKMDMSGTNYGAEVYGIPIIAMDHYGSDYSGCLAGDIWTSADVYQASDVDFGGFDDESWEEEELYASGRPGL